MRSYVAVVEDEPEILQLLSDVLRASEFPVMAYSDPDLIETSEGQEGPRVFLIDLMLPSISGIQLAGELRARGYSDTPMIAMSASRVMLEFAAKSSLFQATLVKPFDVSTVIELVERYAGEEAAS
jgi:CheY-like chemotaxis protein